MTPADRARARAELDALLELSRHREALDAVRTLLAEEPDAALLHGQASRALTGLGDHRGALEAAGRAAALAPAWPWAHRLCATALLELGRPQEAARAAHEAVRLQPDRAVNHEVYAQVLVDAPGGLPTAWLAALHAVRLAPDDAGSHFTVGYVAGRRRDARTAIEAYRRTLAIDPEHATALHNLALLESGTSLRRRADGLAGALRLDPQRRAFHATADAWADRVVRRAWLGSLAALLVAALTGWGGLAGLVLLGLWWRRLMRQVPVGMRRLVRDRVPRSAYPALLAAATVLTCLLALATTVAPLDAGQRWALAAQATWPTVALAAWGLLRRRPG